MAERLTMQEVIEHCERAVIRAEMMRFTDTKQYMEHKQVREWLKELQYYKDLEEAGKLITLPCKIGDTVWDIKWWDDITETKVIDGEKYFRRVMKHKVTKSKFRLFDYDNLGKTVFLTREEAEEALKGVDNERI